MQKETLDARDFLCAKCVLVRFNYVSLLSNSHLPAVLNTRLALVESALKYPIKHTIFICEKQELQLISRKLKLDMDNFRFDKRMVNEYCIVLVEMIALNPVLIQLIKRLNLNPSTIRYKDGIS